MFCSKCGKEVREGSKFCMNCGSEIVGVDKSETVVKKKTEGSSTQLPKIIGAAVVVSAILLLISVSVNIKRGENEREVTKTNIERKTEAYTETLVVEASATGFIESSDAYLEDKYESIPARVDMEVVEADFADFAMSGAIELPAFQGLINDIVYSEIVLAYTEENRDDYCQDISVVYDLFTRKIAVSIVYFRENDEWIKEVEILDDVYTLNDSITGHWVKHVEAIHPMHSDSTITVDIVKVDDRSCDCNYVWTSRIEGGYDDTFQGTYAIRANHDDNGQVCDIQLAYDNVRGYIKITPKGLVYDSIFSAGGTHLLTKEY